MIGGDVVTDSSKYTFQVAIQPLRFQRGAPVRLPVCTGILIAGAAAGAAGGRNYYVLTSARCALS